jgi:GntR family transcriptional regulator
MADWITSSKPYVTPRAPGERDPWELEAERAGHVGRHRITLVDQRMAPAEVARRLGIGAEDLAVLRRRVVTLDDRPVEVSDSWYPTAIAAGTGLAEDKPIKGGAVRLLADLGYTAARHVEDVAMIDPPADAAEILGPGLVIQLIRTSQAADDTVFEVGVMHMSRELTPGVPRRLRYLLSRPETDSGR